MTIPLGMFFGGGEGWGVVKGGRESSTVCTSTFKDLLPTAYCHAAKRSRFVHGVESLVVW